MDVVKRIFRGPLIWIFIGIVVLIVAFQFIGNLGGFKEVTTQQGLELLAGKTVEEVKVVDGEQRVDLTLSEPFKADDIEYGELVQFYYVQPRGSEVIEAITASEAKFD